MRKRRSRKNTTPEQTLISVANEWRKGVSPGRNWEAAIEARKKAEPIFTEHPEWKDNPPADVPKMIFTDWTWFVRFLEPDYRTGYIKAVEKNEWPAEPITTKAQND